VKSLVLDSIGIPEELCRGVPPTCEIIQVPPGKAVQFERVRHARSWIVDARTKVARAVLDQLPHLLAVSKFGVGIDNIAVQDATERRVWVCNTPGVLDDAVAELTIGMIIAAGRKIVAFDRLIRAGAWTITPPELTGQVHGATLGVVGMGRIGRRVAQLASALGMRVVYHNRRRIRDAETRGLAEYVSWPDLFEQCDYVTIHTPLTDETRRLVGSAELARMKATAVLVNTSRGGVIDERALIQCLRERRIAGAALDVFEQEPLLPDHPLRTLDNVILLPHVGSATERTRSAMRELALANAVTAAQGERPSTTINSWQ
jgi:lactate dehydrogenase-like 2-hydroxyacid dehydrogenase